MSPCARCVVASMDKRSFGKRGEDAAALYLTRHGYRIVERNYRLRAAEIDIIAEQGALLLFIEVKTRSSFLYGLAAEAVDKHKQQKIIQAANFYVREQNFAWRPCRFDVIEVYPRGGTCRVHHIENAFSA